MPILRQLLGAECCAAEHGSTYPGGELKQRFWTEKQTAAFLGVQPRTLTMWRYFRRYPLAFVKMGERVYYPQADVRAFARTYPVWWKKRTGPQRGCLVDGKTGGGISWGPTWDSGGLAPQAALFIGLCEGGRAGALCPSGRAGVWEGVRGFEVRPGAAATSEGGRLRQAGSLKSP